MRYRPIAAMLLSTFVTLPVTSIAAQDRDRRDSTTEERERRQEQQRYYDRNHRDYHVWNENEGRMLRQYFEEHRLRPRPFSQMSARQQRDYWNWRHERQQEFDHWDRR